MVSRVFILASMVLAIGAVPASASAREKFCAYTEPVVVKEVQGRGKRFHPAYKYLCRSGNVVYTDHLQFSDMAAFSDAHFDDVASARHWLVRHHAGFLPLRAAFSILPRKAEAKKTASDRLAKMVDVEVIGASAFQLGIVSLTFLPQVRIVKMIRWMLEAPSVGPLSRSIRQVPGTAGRRERERRNSW